jgi:hypothetical protein
MNNKLKFCVAILFLLVVFFNGRAQSFEGNMSGKIAGKDVNLFIWADIKVDKDNGSVTGSYFYKNIGKEISLSGKTVGKELTLLEKDIDKVTGIFSLKNTSGNYIGSWHKPNSADSLKVELFRTNPSFKSTSRFPNFKKLLKEDIEFYNEGLNGNDSEQGLTYSVIFARNNLLSVELNWENYWYTAHYGTFYYTFNLATGDKIELKDDINDSGSLFLCNKIQEIVTSRREEYADSEWIDGLYSYMDSTEAKEKINDLFNVAVLPGKAQFYLSNEGLACYIEDYCEQYYSSGNRGMTFDCFVCIPFDKLKQYVKRESVLWNFLADKSSIGNS